MPADRAILFRLATSTRLERAARAAPLGERLAWRAASRYVAGTTAAAAARVARELHDRGVSTSIDQFGELVQDTATAGQVTVSYLRLADQVNALPADTWLSVDLSHLGLDVDPPACADHLAAIASRLSAGRRIQVGAEDYSRADAVLACVEAVASRGLAGSGPRPRPTSAVRHTTWSGSSRLASTSAWSRALTSSRTTARCPTGNPPTSLTCGLRTGSLRAARNSPSRPTTASCARPCSPRWVPGLSSSCSGSVPRFWATSSPAASRSACTCRSATTGSATGCGASPNPGVPDAATPACSPSRRNRGADSPG